MGANQSFTGDGSRGPGAETGRGTRELKTCYYEILGVDRQASEDGIKKAYRRKALELHPDRNYGNVDETTNQFAAVQSAYEILSDPQERAWYDTHRDTILRDEDGASAEHYHHDVRITTTEDLMRLLHRFHTKIDYSDSGSGFYGALREVFSTLAKEESLACEWEGLEPVVYPSFGYAKDSYEDLVRPFYAAWSSFSTKKTFSWEDVYRYAEAPDRRVRRMMEKENKRFRDDGIREFNDAVRLLVAFTKKRDPRFRPNVQTEAQRQQILRDAAVAQAARARAANQAKHAESKAVPEWTHPCETQDEEISNEAEEAIQQQFECVVCQKSFKSEKQYEAHEKSKKHVKALQYLRRRMQQEDRILNLEGSSGQSNVQHVSSISVANMESISNINGTSHGEGALTSVTSTSDDQTSEVVAKAYENTSDAEHVQLADKARSGTKVLESSSSSSSSSSDNDYTTREKIEARILGDTNTEDSPPQLETSQVDIANISDDLASGAYIGDSPSNTHLKIGKAKEKRAKKAAQKPSTTQGHEAEF